MFTFLSFKEFYVNSQRHKTNLCNFDDTMLALYLGGFPNLYFH